VKVDTILQTTAFLKAQYGEGEDNSKRSARYPIPLVSRQNQNKVEEGEDPTYKSRPRDWEGPRGRQECRTSLLAPNRDLCSICISF
jgi:hypothetical protein